MLRLFKSNEKKMVEELNKLVANVTILKWEHNKEGYCLNFPLNGLSADVLQVNIKYAFPDLNVLIKGNGFNAKNGMRVIITPEKKLTVEHIENAKKYLADKYPNATGNFEHKK